MMLLLTCLVQERPEFEHAWLKFETDQLCCVALRSEEKASRRLSSL